MTNRRFKRCVVVGLGLMGGSFAAAVRARRCAEQVVGCTLKAEDIAMALQLELIDQGFVELASALADADLVVIATPVAAIESIFKTIALHTALLDSAVIITDLASVKEQIIDWAEQWIPRLHYVPGHPIVGSERAGVLAANAHLYEHQQVVLVHRSEPAGIEASVQEVEALWQSLGANTLWMSAAAHDRTFALTSHLPHLLAYSLVDSLAGDPAQHDIFRFAASGFRDFTRIAASDPIMWRDIFFSNKTNILAALDEFSAGLTTLRTALVAQDHETMLGILTRSQVARQYFQAVLEQRSFTSFKQLQEYGPMNQPCHFLVQPGGQCVGEIQIPGDKSISHRAIMFGAIAQGTTRITGFLEGEDALATLQSFRDMGVVIEGPSAGEVVVHGVGMQGLKAPKGDLYVGNSGTTIRLLPGILVGQHFKVRLVGDATIMRRPMARVAKPLTQMGAQIHISAAGTPPVEIEPSPQPLQAINYTMPIVSAQVKSALLLAGLYSHGTTCITEIGPARDHTERMLQAFGVQINCDKGSIRVAGQQQLQASNIEVPADISSAAFFLVAGCIAPQGNLKLPNIGVNPTRTGVLDILRLMGADITLSNQRMIGGEPVADLEVRASELQGIAIPEALVPLAIDEFPALFIAAACAQGITKLTGAAELRVKESDRIAAMASGLQTLGIDAQAQPDGIIIQGKGGYSSGAIFNGGEIETFGDHRIAMAFALTGLRSSANVLVRDVAHVATSFPKFLALAQRVGLNIR